MKPSLNILRGELERLFSTTGLDELCGKYLGIDPVALGIADDSKAVYSRKLAEWADVSEAPEALADAMLTVKKGMLDPRIKQVYADISGRGMVRRDEMIGFKIFDKIASDDAGVQYACEPEDAEGDAHILWVVNGEHALLTRAVQRFLVLWRILGDGSDPSIPSVRKVGMLEDGRPWVIYRTPAGTVSSEAGSLTQREALGIVESTLDTLEKIHATGLVHGDIRRRNIWVALPEDSDSLPSVVLTGAGFDRLLRSGGWTRAISLVNSMAPEVIRGEDATPASDFYSLGVLLFELVCGKPAFTGRRAMDVAASHLRGDKARLAELTDAPVPDALLNLLDSLITREVSARPKGVAEIRKLIDDARRGILEAEARAMQTGSRDDITLAAEVLLENPGNVDALNELVIETRKFNAWSAAIEVLEEAALAGNDPAIAHRLLMVAADASTRFTRNYEKAEEIYTQLAQDGIEPEAVMTGHLALLKAQGRFDDVIAVLGASAEAADDATTKLAILLEMASVIEKDMKEPAKAFDYYMACISGADKDREIVATLEKIAATAGRFEELVQSIGTVAAAVEGAGNRDLAVFFYRKLGSWYLNRLDQAAYALTCYQKVLQGNPGDTEALDAIVDMYRKAQQWPELASVLIQRAQLEQTPTLKRGLLCEAARVYYERLSETTAAREVLEEVLKDDPGAEEASRLLQTIYEKTSAWEPLAELLSGSAASVKAPADIVALQFRLGEIFELHLSNRKSATIHYEKAIAADEKHLDSLKGLERIYAMDENFAGLRIVLERQLALAVTPKQKVTLLERLAAIYDEEFKEVEKAIDAYRQITEIDSEHLLAINSLIRLYRKAKQNEPLVELLHRKAQLSKSDDEKRDLLAERAEIIRDEIKDASRASLAFNELAELGGDDTVLLSVVKSQIQLGDFTAAESTYRKMESEAADDQARSRILIQLATLQLDSMKNISEAESTLHRAKLLSPDSKEIVSALSNVQIAKGDYMGAIKSLEEQIEMAEGSKSRAEIYTRMGLIAADKIEDIETATSHFEHAIGLDSSNLVAADRLSTLYRKAKLWEKALPIYERWIPSVDSLPTESQIDLLSYAGEAYLHVNRRERALELFKKAAEKAQRPDLVMRLGEVALEMEEWKLARDQFLRYQESVGASLTNDQKVDLFVKRGKAAFGAEDFDEAAKMARQATVLAPDDLESRILLADVHEARGDFRGSVEARTKALDALTPDDPRYLSLLRSNATVMFEKLRNGAGAAQLLNDALASDPTNRDILNELLKIHNAGKKWDEVVGVILRIADLEDDDIRISKFYFTAAKIYRRELKQFDNAVTYFERALEKNAEMEDARTALQQVLTEAKNWEGLERFYKKAISDLPKDATTEDRLAIYGPLADLYVTKLERKSDGIMLLETICKLEPQNLSWREKLSDLYGWSVDHAEKAVANHNMLLESNITRMDSFRMLYRIYSAMEEPDRAWCAASMLSVLNQAGPEERQYHKDYLSEDYPPFANRLEDSDWDKLLYHEELNHDISKIFSIIMPAIAQAKCQPLQSFGLDPAQAIDITQDPSPFSQLVNFGVGIFGIPAMPMFFQSPHKGFAMLNTYPSVLLTGAESASMKDPLGLSFKLGQQMTLLRPGLFVKQLISSGTELSSWLLAAVKLFAPALPIPGALAGTVNERLAPIRQALSPEASEKLQGYVQSFISQAADVNLKRWAKAVTYTGDRTGLLMCGDISIAQRVLKTQVSDDKELAERIRALYLYTISDKHFMVRDHLGIALKAG